jgi:hypothetical protein
VLPLHPTCLLPHSKYQKLVKVERVFVPRGPAISRDGVGPGYVVYAHPIRFILAMGALHLEELGHTSKLVLEENCIRFFAFDIEARSEACTQNPVWRVMATNFSCSHTSIVPVDDTHRCLLQKFRVICNLFQKGTPQVGRAHCGQTDNDTPYSGCNHARKNTLPSESEHETDGITIYNQSIKQSDYSDHLPFNQFHAFRKMGKIRIH